MKKESYGFLLKVFKDSIEYKGKNNVTQDGFLDTLRELMQNSDNDNSQKESTTSGSYYKDENLLIKNIFYFERVARHKNPRDIFTIFQKRQKTF